MANPEHVEIVSSGCEAVGIWRRRFPRVVLDLSKAALRNADLSRSYLAPANFRSADLTGANLHGSSLQKADFSRAKMHGSNLQTCRIENANFSEADLAFADLTGAFADGANFTKVSLHCANLTDLHCSGTDFHASIVSMTTFANVDLSEARHLDRVDPRAPSSIGVDTLIRSQGKIPDAFLRDCGVPDALIAYLPSLLSSGIDFYSSFISHSHKDKEFAHRLHSRMQQERLRVWYAPEDIAGGKKLHEQIVDAIRVYDKLLLVLSEYSMASEWVRTEIRRARKRERDEGRRVLFPIRVVDFAKIAAWECFDADNGKDLAVEIREYHIPDFSRWKNHDKFEAEFAKLLRDLKQSREPPKAQPT